MSKVTSLENQKSEFLENTRINQHILNGNSIINFVISEQDAYKVRIETTNLPTGMYYLSISINGQSLCQDKFIKM